MLKTETNPAAFPDSEAFSLGEVLEILWAGRWTILAWAIPCLTVAGFLAWRATPVYEVTAMLQVEGRPPQQALPALQAKAEGLSDVEPELQGEAEILRSNQILGRVVKNLDLDLVAAPDASFLFGSALTRGRPDAPRIEVAQFDPPDAVKGVSFTIKANADGTFDWLKGGRLLAQGRPGVPLQASWEGEPLQLTVKSLTGKPGQTFRIVRQPLMTLIDGLRDSLFVEEKGKESNILALTLDCPEPRRGAEVLNAILDQFNLDNIERRTEEASKTLAILNQDLADMRDRELRSEALLNQRRGSDHSVDLAEEARMHIQQDAELERQVIALRGRREELLRTYLPHSDVVANLDQQIAKLQEERARLNARISNLPQTAQEVLRLTREVQTNQEQYSSLVNLQTLTLQQRQLARAGEIGITHIVDRAMPTLRPVKPAKSIALLIGGLIGALLGITQVLTLRILRRGGLEDPQALESAFALPVLATIPHSDNQAALAQAMAGNNAHGELLSNAFPVDGAVESLRSLRTSLNFSLVDAPNQAILFAGPAPSMGKSFVAANFAVVLAQHGFRALLVDADMRKGNLHRYFSAGGRKGGLSEILAGTLPWEAALRHAHGLDMISSGILPPNPPRLLASDRFRDFLANACAAYDFVIFDAPPILAVTDAAIIGGQVGAVLLVIKDGLHPLGEVRAALQTLDRAGVRTKGFVFNDFSTGNGALGYRRYAYHYSYQN